MKIHARTLSLMLLCAVALTPVSCNRNKTDKATAPLPPEHTKMVEAYNKSIEESKKVIVAKVNGVDITMNDLIREMNAIGPQYLKPGQKRDPQLDKKVEKDALDRLIYRELAVQDAIKQGLNVPPQVMKQEMQKLRARFKTEDAFRASLAKQGVTEDELRKAIQRDLLVEMITEKEIFDKVKVDPALVKKTYEKEKGSFIGPTGKQMSLEEARPIIEQKLMTPLVHKREDAWVDELKKSAKIQITMDESAKKIHSIQ